MSGNRQLHALVAAGLSDRILLPGDAAYEARIDSWWSASSRLRPSCIVQPSTAEDVAAAFRALAECASGCFAVRSGGHSHWAGGSNIDDGVTIDLVHLRATTYDAATKTASLGPAQKWVDVFEALEAQHVMVAGGRSGDVGVGGLLTGGGISYHSGCQGFACDNLINAQVVLADGSIVDANAHHHSDLWKALKGGLGNFGIVTRLDVRAFDFEAGQVWGGTRALDMSQADAIIDAVINFTNNNDKRPEAALATGFTYEPNRSPDIMIEQFLVDTGGVANPPIFQEVQRIPELSSDIKKRSMSGIAGYGLPAGLRNTFFTLSFKNDKRVATKAVELYKAFTADLANVVDANELASQMFLQPIPRIFTNMRIAKGSNVLGLDEIDGNALLWLFIVSTKTSKHEAVVHRKMSAMTAELRQYSEMISAAVPWIYANYADPSQDALKSYGASNLKFMRQVSEKYDPNGIFQRRVPGSFKL